MRASSTEQACVRVRMRGSRAPSDNRSDVRPGERDRVGKETREDGGLLVAEPPAVALADLDDARSVARPAVHVPCERVDLLLPTRIVLSDLIGSDDEEVDVAPRVPLSACGGPEQRRMHRRNRPALELVPEAVEKVASQGDEGVDGRGREMITVEPVQQGRTGLLDVDDPVI